MRLNDLDLDDNGFCALRFDERLVVHIQHLAREDQLLLYADLGPPALGAALYADLLRGNLFWRATLGATLSLSEDEPAHVVIAQKLAWQPLDEAALEQHLERFVNIVEDWQGMVSAEIAEVTVAPGAPLPASGEGIVRA
jgi:hypothetical protein